MLLKNKIITGYAGYMDNCVEIIMNKSAYSDRNKKNLETRRNLIKTVTVIKKTILLAVISIVFSCKKINVEEVNRYQIISLLFEELAKPTELVYGSNIYSKPYTKSDSMRIDSLHDLIRKERVKRKFIVAVYPKLIPYNKGHYKYFSKKCAEYNEMMNKLMMIKDSSYIDLKKILSKRNDSIISFKKELLTKGTKEFIKFDYLIAFSPIAFNKNYTKSIVCVSGSKSKLASTTDLYMLEKKNGKWEIKCKVNLEIS